MSKASEISQILKKKYGDVVIQAVNLASVEGRVIPTTLGLDLALNGGMPEGIIMNVSGWSKCGKTTLVLTIAANAQKFGKRVYYLDVEGRLRTDLLKCIDGLDVDNFEVIRSSKDKILSAEDYINIATDLTKNDPGCLIILDSITTLCPEDTLNGMAGESKRLAGVPSLMYEFLRKMTAILPVTLGNIITLAHLQDNPSAYGGPKEGGGNAIQYYSSIRLICHSAPEVPKTGRPKIGKDSIFKVTASALGPPSGEAVIFIRYGRGCDKYEDLVYVAIEMGLVEQKAAWYYYGEEKFQGKETLVNTLRENSDMYSQLEADVRKMVLG